MIQVTARRAAANPNLFMISVRSGHHHIGQWFWLGSPEHIGFCKWINSHEYERVPTGCHQYHRRYILQPKEA